MPAVDRFSAGSDLEPPSAPAAPLLARFAFALVLAVLAGLVVAEVRGAPAGTAGQRVGRRVELAELIRVEQARADALTVRAAELQAQLEVRQHPVEGDETADALEAQIAQVAGAAQMTKVRGPGMIVTLDYAAPVGDDVGNYNNLVIHEQDLQAVVNALWAGGAEAMTVAGERVLATTAIRCVGNVLLLHGGTYSPPYEISAIGDESALRRALQEDPTVIRFGRAVNEFDLGFEVMAAQTLELPAYDGTTTFEVAEPTEVIVG